MRLDILDRVHEGHLWIAKCRERAKTSVWLPGLSTQIKSMVENCQTCARHREQRPVTDTDTGTDPDSTSRATMATNCS